MGRDAFRCPHCRAYAHQRWFALVIGEDNGWKGIGAQVTRCERCGRYAYWVDEKLVYPPAMQGPPPHPDMPDEPRADYIEARTIVSLSPRGACALLRLALQKLCKELGERGKDPNRDIANLVKKGLSIQVQQALDSLRVVGNNAVHPGEFDVTDDVATATALFECLNLIVDQLIAQPKRIGELYARLPEGARSAIDQRDAT
jgi:hypothetical protein